MGNKIARLGFAIQAALVCTIYYGEAGHVHRAQASAGMGVMLTSDAYYYGLEGYTYQEEQGAYVLTDPQANAAASLPPSAVDESRVVIPEPLQYKVNPGDTVYRISRMFGVTVDALVSANGLPDPGKLKVGQTLEIPVEGEALIMPDGEKKVIQKVLNATLTAYTAGAESTGKQPSHPAYGITASGSKVKEGRTIAVDPNVIPLGSTVYIDGIGIRTAEDKGSAIRGTKIDVYMEDLRRAIQFGVKKNVKVYVLSLGKT